MGTKRETPALNEGGLQLQAPLKSLGDSYLMSVDLIAASGDEDLLNLDLTVDKVAGNYALIQGNVTEISAPGSDNRLLDLRVGGLKKVEAANDGSIRSYGAFTDNSNYERLEITGNTIAVQQAGTGVAQDLNLKCGNNFTDVILRGDSVYSIIDATKFNISGACIFGWSSGTASTTADTTFKRHAAGIAELQQLVISALPTSDPTNTGQLWNNSGVLNVSA